MSAGLIPLMRPAWPSEMRPDPLELLAGLGAELRDRAVVEVGRDPLVLKPSKSLDLIDSGGRCSRRTLPRSSPGRSRRQQTAASPSAGSRSTEVVPGRLGPAQSTGKALRPRRASLESRSRKRPIAVAAALEPLPASVVDQPDSPARARSAAGRHCRGAATADTRPGW